MALSRCFHLGCSSTKCEYLDSVCNESLGAKSLSPVRLRCATPQSTAGHGFGAQHRHSTNFPNPAPMQSPTAGLFLQNVRRRHGSES
jgi:hypothetical protein